MSKVKIGENVCIENTAIIEDDVVIGDNCYIGHYAILRPGTVIGDNSEVRSHCFLAGDVKVGNNVKIFQFSNIGKGSIIEDDVYIGVRVLFTNTRKIAWRRDYEAELKPPYVKRGARIASGAILMPGVIIGEDSLVGAGALVDKNIPDRQIWFGVPARKKGEVPLRELSVNK